MNNNEKTYDLIKNITNSILSNKNNQNDYQEQILNNKNIKNNESGASPQEKEKIEQLINKTKLESSRDKLDKIYNFFYQMALKKKQENFLLNIY